MNRKFLLILISILFFLSWAYAAEKTLLLQFFVFKNDTALVNEIRVATASPWLPREGDYFLEARDRNGNILFITSFKVSFIILEEPPRETDEALIYMRIPWNENFSKINIFHQNKLIHRIELSQYLCNRNGRCEPELGESYSLCPDDCRPICGNRICEPFENYTSCCLDCGCPEELICKENRCIEERCGNKICESFSPYDENYKNCPKDCPSGSKDNYCDGMIDGRCDPDCRKEEDVDCVKPVSSWVYVAIGIIIVVLISIIIAKRGR